MLDRDTTTAELQPEAGDPVLEVDEGVGSRPVGVRVGEVGAGSALKICLNQSLGVLAAGLGESLRLGRELGLDRDLLLEVLSMTGYGWFLGQKRSMLDSGDFTATTFSVDLMAKDLRLAVDASHGGLPVTAACAEAAAAAADVASGQDYAVLTASVADGLTPGRAPRP